MTNLSDRDTQVVRTDDELTDVDQLDPEYAPSRVSVYDRPQRGFSPWILVFIVVLLLMAAYFAIQYFV